MIIDDHTFVSDRLTFYAQHLSEDVLSWWLANAVDRQYGGVFTFWNGTGTELKSTDKYVWSQGRWVWTLAALSRLARRGLVSGVDSAELLRLAEQSAEFLKNSAILDDGTCANFVTREGKPTLGFTGSAMHSSVYADLFVALGFAGLARELNSAAWAERAEQLLLTAAGRIADGSAVTAPYPVRPGFTGFGPQMILINTATEVFRVTRSEASARIALAAAQELRNRFFSDGLDSPELKTSVPDLAETVEARHRNPGHVLESLWFIVDASEVIPGAEEMLGGGLKRWLLDVLDHECSRGWDDEFGGLLRFVDKDGGQPHGTSSDTAYERTVLDSWDSKLWWPHNEALYTALLLWTRTGDARAMAWFRRLDDYTFSKFPAGAGNEWNQILTRPGVPGEPDPRALLPVKDPYHLMRSLLLLVELSDELDTHNIERKIND
jgi:N-acylglucosamine 2-epimerase